MLSLQDLLALGGLASLVVGGIGYIARSTSKDWKAVTASLGTDIRSLTKSVDELRTDGRRSDDLHRDMSRELGALDARVKSLEARPTRGSRAKG